MKHNYLLAIANKEKISSVVATKEIHEFPYTDEVMTDFKESCKSHSGEDVFILAITYLGQY